MHFRGNTLVDVSPRLQGPGYPVYLRDYMKKDKAPTKKVSRFVPDKTIGW
jgi:hypothetical protein